MPYTHFRYIAYQVPTVASRVNPITGANEVKYGIPPGNVTNPPALAGNVGNLGADARSRVERFYNAMILAYNTIQAYDNANTLKIFIAPEFYFRPDNLDVSYTYTQYQAIKDVLRNTIMFDNRFDDWLIIPGTIMWKQDQSTPKRPLNLLDEVFFNSSMYLKTEGFVTSHVIEKVRASPIDGIPTGRHGGSRTSPLTYSTDEYYPQYNSFAKRQKHVFTVGGIEFGLEICLEHHMQVVKGVMSWLPRVNGVQLQLLTAGGMGVVAGSLATKVGGYILRSDGYYGVGGYVDMKEVSSYTGGNFQTLASTANFSPIGNFYDDVPISNAVTDVYLAPPAGYAASWNPTQLIRIYYSCLIP